MIICSQCGNTVTDGARSCSECGAANPLVHAARASKGAGLQSPPPLGTESLGPQFIRDAAAPSSAPAGAARRSPLPVIGVTATATVFVTALIFFGARAWFKVSDKESVPAAGTEVTSAQSESATSQPQPSASRPQDPSQASRSVTAGAPAVEREVTEALNGWAAASRAHDLDSHLSYYADVLDTYYQRSNVSADFVRSDRARAYNRYHSLDVQLSNIEVTLDSSVTRASAVFDKTFHFEGDKYLDGSVRQVVWLSKVNGRWLITGEKDLRVYYVNR